MFEDMSLGFIFYRKADNMELDAGFQLVNEIISYEKAGTAAELANVA